MTTQLSEAGQVPYTQSSLSLPGLTKRSDSVGRGGAGRWCRKAECRKPGAEKGRWKGEREEEGERGWERRWLSSSI